MAEAIGNSSNPKSKLKTSVYVSLLAGTIKKAFSAQSAESLFYFYTSTKGTKLCLYYIIR